MSAPPSPRRAALLASAVSAVMAVGLPWAGAAQSGPEPLAVFAPASLAEAMPAAAEAWRGAGAGRPPVRVSIDATSRLAPQVAAGAPADLVVTADEAWMD
ncbi:MAG: molybdate ABC transporter substrate-binding protein, partial [Gemmatimonadetes bacterium]